MEHPKDLRYIENPFNNLKAMSNKNQTEWHFDAVKLKKLRKLLDKKDEEEIKQALITYSETIELIYCRYPNFGTASANWALAMAMSPEWYGEALSNRLQNSMLVSALLLTVTAAYFLEPPETIHPKDSAAFRGFIYLTGFSNMLFLLSIVFGIFFIENAMSRTYGQSERFILIIKFFVFKNLTQIFMAIGSALFPVCLAIPMWKSFLQLDAYVLLVFTIIYIVAVVGNMTHSSMIAGNEQSRRLKLLEEFIDPSTCRLKPEYYPGDADMQPEDFREMYTV